MYTRQNLAVGLVLAISMVGVSYGADGILPGDGLSESTAYLIEDLTDFDVFADPANSATYWSSGVYTKLACDPNLAGRIYATAVIAPDTPDTDWKFNGIPFKGIFDGNGHIISYLTIDTMGAGNEYLGLFGKIEDSSSEVKNLGIENINITGGANSDCLGGLCGDNYYGTITNCYAAGSVTGYRSLGGLCGGNSGTITNCYAAGSVTGGNDSCSLGSLCGYSYGTITNCYAAGSVIGDSWLGGLCGCNGGGTITNCYAAGSVTGRNYLGGLCGFNKSTISNCYATGSVTGGNWSDYLGGLCGRNGNDYSSGTITNCYATGSITSGDNSDYLGGLCGRNYDAITNCFWDVETGGPDNGVGTPKTTAEMQMESTFTDANWNFSVAPDWRMPFAATGYPMLSWQRDIPGDFTGSYGVDMVDLATIMDAWLSDDTPTANWNEDCDLDPSGVIDTGDLKIFAEHWLCD